MLIHWEPRNLRVYFDLIQNYLPTCLFSAGSLSGQHSAQIVSGQPQALPPHPPGRLESLLLKPLADEPGQPRFNKVR